MSDHGEAYLCAVGREENVYVDKKTSIANSTSQWSLMSSMGTLIILCTTFLPFLLTVLPFILRMEHHFGGLYILKCNITTQDTTCTDNCPEIHRGKENHLFKQILCLNSTGNLPLAKKFHVVFDYLDESKLTHLLRIADVQTTRVHFEEQVRETKLLAMDDKSCLNLAIICNPVDFNQVL